MITEIDHQPLRYADMLEVLGFFADIEAGQKLALTVHRGTETLNLQIEAALMTPEQRRRWRENYELLKRCQGKTCGDG